LAFPPAFVRRRRLALEKTSMMREVEDRIYKTVCEANRKLTPLEVERASQEATGADRKKVRDAMRALVLRGALSYTNIYGTSFLEPSFDRPVKVSQRIVVKPPHRRYAPCAGELVIDIAGGAAFGSGAHPTTRLALRAMDGVLDRNFSSRRKEPLTGLDVGTGSGILAVALARLGVARVVGLDRDPCALSEARHNVSLNGLAEKVAVTCASLKEVPSHFSVIVANLAYPTLREISADLTEKLEERGRMILSGFKGHAAKELARVYKEQGLSLVGKDAERAWVCLVFTRPKGP
jgi:ribosomal protein L11 methyltransferase